MKKHWQAPSGAGCKIAELHSAPRGAKEYGALMAINISLLTELKPFLSLKSNSD
jgi:hypothetical protein